MYVIKIILVKNKVECSIDLNGILRQANQIRQTFNLFDTYMHTHRHIYAGMYMHVHTFTHTCTCLHTIIHESHTRTN